MATHARRHDAYTIGWICALSKEQTAATAMLDERHQDLPKSTNDPNTYTFGSIGGHNIAIACLPEGKIGTNPAAVVASHMVHAFPAIRFGQLVGIGGGIPSKVRLGDVVVSVPGDQHPGVVQWDMGKAEQGGKFRRTGALNNPPTSLRTALTKLKTGHELDGSKISQYLEELQIRYPRLAEKYLRSDSLQDILFKASHSHVVRQDEDASKEEEDASEDDAEEDCRYCDKTQIVKRRPRDMRVHYGLIASGNQVVKDASFRDQLSKDLDKKVLCIEMEAAGLMDNFPCIVIRGICDYADSHKNKAWQEHAAAVAAAFAKELLGYVQLRDVDGEETVKDVLAKVSSELCETKSQVAQTKLILKREEDLKVLNWLTPVDFGPQHSDYLRRRQPGTGQWLLDCDTYQRWVEEPGQRLFCPGIPGAGKTILSSVVIDDLESRFSADLTTAVVYVYCNFNRRAEQRLEHLMSSLLKQLASNSPPLPQVLSKLHEKHAKKQTRPTLEEISTALRTVTAIFARVFIIVDALDECQVADDCRTRFLQQLFSLQTQQRSSVFATSRHIPDIKKEFLNSLTIEIRASEEDIGRYVESAVSRLPKFIGERGDLQTEITQTISQIVDGMFLLAQLYCDTLTDKYNPTAVREALENLKNGSKSYETAYDGAMNRIEGQLKGQAELAKQVLAWITCAQRPLTKTELQHALAVKIGETKLNNDSITQVHDMVSVCAGLITIDEASSIIRLVHYTTQNYFECMQGKWFPIAHSTLAATCITYLSFKTFADGRCQSDQEFEDRLDEYRFFEYAASYWGHHARAAPGFDAVLGFLQNTAQINASVQAYFTDRQWIYPGYSQKAPSGMVATHLAAIFGLRNIISTVWNNRNQDARDSTSRTPLWWAARYGHTEVVKILLERMGVDVNAKDNTSRTPLRCAAETGHTEVVKILLKTKEVDVNAKDNTGRTTLSWAARYGNIEVAKLLLEKKEVDINARDTIYGQTPLWCAARYGYIEVAKLLLERKEVDVNAKDTIYGQTPLRCAAENGHTDTVKLLLEKKEVDINAKDTIYGQTPLRYAAENGHTDMVKLLLEKKEVDINAKDTIYGQTPLWCAAENGHTEVVDLLFERMEVDVNAEDTIYGQTLLRCAAENGHTEMVKLLFETKKVNVNANDTIYSQTPLWWAARYGFTEVAKLLLKIKEVDVNAKDTEYGQTPLWCAAQNGHTEVVQLLLQRKEVDVNAKDTEYGQTPLWWAAENGHTKAIKILLQTKEVDVNAKDNNGRTPLSWAARYRHMDMVKLLLERKEVNVNAKDTIYGQTPLWCATRYGYAEVVKLLLKRKEIDVNAKDNTGRTPLWCAAENGHAEVIKLLLETIEVDVNARDTIYGQTPLWCATRFEHTKVVKLLLKRKEVDANAKDTIYGQTPLRYAAENGRTVAVKLLLETKEVDVNTKDPKYNRTSLWWAARYGYIEVVKLLLERVGVDVNAKDNTGHTPLWCAAENGHTEVVKLLIGQGADIHISDKYNVNALQAASREGYQDIAELLREIEVDQHGMDLERPVSHFSFVHDEQKESDEKKVLHFDKRKRVDIGQESIAKKPHLQRWNALV